MTINYDAAHACLVRWSNEGIAMLRMDDDFTIYAGICRWDRTDEECEKLIRQMKVELLMYLCPFLKLKYRIYETEEELNKAVDEAAIWLEKAYKRLEGLL